MDYSDERQARRDAAEAKVKKLVKWAVFGVIGVAVLFFASSFYFVVDSGESVVYQNTLSGQVTGYTTPGYQGKIPFMNRIWEYDKFTTVTFTDATDGEGSIVQRSVLVRFPDNYKGQIEASFRFQLPLDGPALVQLHDDFKSYGAVNNRLLMRVAKHVMVQAGNMLTSEEFFQGGISTYTGMLTDFLTNGVPVTEKRQVEIQVAQFQEEGKKVGAKTVRQKQFVEKHVPIIKDGVIVRQPNPLEKYGIVVTLVTIGRTTPEKDLEKQIDRTKKIFANRRAIRAEQENERQARATAKLKGERLTEEASQAANLKKAVAVVNAEKRVELATQEKERVLVEKNQQLEAANIDKRVQISKAIAAKSEAIAIRQVGLAEAQVDLAKWRAKNNPVYLAELRLETSKVIAGSLKGMTITMPSTMINMGGGTGNGGNTSVDQLVKVITSQLGLKLASEQNAKNANRDVASN